MWPKEFGKAHDMDISAGRDMHQAIVARLMTGPGDSDGAMHRAERVLGLPYWCQFNLRHKRRASLEFLFKVRAAYVATLERSVASDLEQLKTQQARGGADDVLAGLVVEAENLLAKIKSRKEVT